MTCFVDTSALYALLDEDDANHGRAISILARLRGEELVTHAYVIVETLALVVRRLGWAATTHVIDVILPVIAVQAVDESLHLQALAAYREAGSTGVSLVDRTSFAFMRTHRVARAFAFDTDFESAGFTLEG